MARCHCHGFAKHLVGGPWIEIIICPAGERVKGLRVLGLGHGSGLKPYALGLRLKASEFLAARMQKVQLRRFEAQAHSFESWSSSWKTAKS